MKESDMLIRKFAEQDLNKIFTIENQSFSDPWTLQEFKFLSELADVVFLVAEKKDRVLGYVIAVREHQYENCTKLYGRILNLAVASQCRRRGIGSKLLEKAIKLLDVKEIWLEVRKFNSIAIQFYQKKGFKVVGIIPLYYQDEAAIRMIKLL